MNYIVTHEEDNAVALDLGDGEKPFDLDGAVAFAKRLIDGGNGNRVTGADLVQVCAGAKRLTEDLRTV